ncbi:pyrroloquinoline quinone biosynthesis protein PqqF [Erwinia sp. QL-Z3]|uniref:pyrroloquinoline quinone biosynthesis protein PqqF n=1 Tax=Erwinia sp. QL-Z3 TaxID=2547962 RepID=UPI001070C22A|nr:pyrroloquinoline quinone biosynthesis protein PqqF [Erwinia sp. QL-Z3]QBR49084.1 pyrroloquinoline quinone biosynthesis protein PqqF [Erwinia sp. QL-Z3]
MSQAAPGEHHRTLANGLRIALIHDPSASRAAALLQLSAGSHQAPEQWPGLAHLLEHVLFAGSENYRDENRLMAWGPANGARLNATTLAHHTAWFFDIASARFDAGLRRLVDMLARPLLSLEAIAQETTVIDAEFQMLTRHSDSLCEVALSQAVAAPHRLHDFHVGNRSAFGEDTGALQQALRDYHQRFFRAPNLQLWLHGPQSLDALGELAEQVAAAFTALAAGDNGRSGLPQQPVARRQDAEQISLPQQPEPLSPLTLTAARHYALRLPSAHRLQLSVVIPAADRQMLALFSQLLTDKAQHSLLATLRDLNLCDDISLLEPYRSPQQSLISVQFDLCESASPARVEAVFSQWLRQSASLNPEALAHYARLAQRHVDQLSGLDRLRARAFGFAPAEPSVNLLEGWRTLRAAMQPASLTRLWVTPGVEVSRKTVQGFTLDTGELSWPEASCDAPQMTFYAPGQPLSLPALPVETAALQWVNASCAPLLLLNPQAGQPFSRRDAATLEAALQPVIGLCQHQGGELSLTQRQGIWLIQLSGSASLMQNRVAAMIEALSSPTAAAIAQGDRLYRKALRSERAEIAIRVLLGRLPEVLSGSAAEPLTSTEGLSGFTSQPLDAVGRLSATPRQAATAGLNGTPWQATLYGGDNDLQLALSRLLSRWPAGIMPCPDAGLIPSPDGRLIPSPDGRLIPSPDGGTMPGLLPHRPPFSFPTESDEAALLLFCPLAENSAQCLAAWQWLASLFEPRFFQKLRVELNIGYVVSCRFHQSAGVAGMLFALQSPTLNQPQLSQHIVDFIADMAEVIDTITDDQLREKSTMMSDALPASAPQSHTQVLDSWQQQQLHLPPLTADIFSALSVEKIQQYYRVFATENHRWFWLNNSPFPSASDNASGAA